MKATRHNGRSGKNGSYNPKHNDRNFNLEHSEHIDATLALENVYWDCYVGKRDATATTDYDSFDTVELRFYEENYQNYVIGQNERNEKNRHTERNRTIEEIYQNKKTCPEESIYQLGNMDGHVDPRVLLQVTESFLEWFEEKFGEYVHVLDWALHVDEATPHIHERHVFDAPNKYGEIFPQQDKALELLGIELPYPDKPRGKTNNRKMVFDAICRAQFLECCESYGLTVDKEAEYGGRKYLEKNDFIIQNQKHRLSKVNEELISQTERLEEANVQIEAIDTVMGCIADVAYETSCNLVVDSVGRNLVNLQISEIQKTDEEVENSSSLYISSSERHLMRKVVTAVVDKLQDTKEHFMKVFRSAFLGPGARTENVKQVKNSIWKKLEALAKSGIKEEDIKLSKDTQPDKAEEVAEHAQEVATQMIRRRRGR